VRTYAPPKASQLTDEWLDRAGAGCPSWARKTRRGRAPLRAELDHCKMQDAVLEQAQCQNKDGTGEVVCAGPAGSGAALGLVSSSPSVESAAAIVCLLRSLQVLRSSRAPAAEACCVRVVRDLAYVAAGGLECSSVISDARQLHHLLCTALVHHLPESDEERLLCVNLGVERKHLFKSIRQLIFVRVLERGDTQM
jgi:hypothetical protein